jgi:putative ABC transport system substrate-binding protein
MKRANCGAAFPGPCGPRTGMLTVADWGDDMKRREFIAALGPAAMWPFPIRAQQVERPKKVGTLFGGIEAGIYLRLWKAFSERLRELGWTEGTNIVFERRFANNVLDRLPALAAELVQLDVDVIYATGSEAPVRVKQATSTIPIVFASISDPVGAGLVASLARPGGNVTGTSFQVSQGIGVKRLQLLKEVLPNLSRVSILWEVNRTTVNAHKEAEAAAGPLGITIHSVEVRSSADLDNAYEVLLQQRPEALLIFGGPLILSRNQEIADMAARNRLPSIVSAREFAELGGLMTYGASLSDSWRRAAGYVDKILKGAKPSDLPVEQPTNFELVINLKTAKAIGIEIPASVLAQATEVIE